MDTTARMQAWLDETMSRLPSWSETNTALAEVIRTASDQMSEWQAKVLYHLPTLTISTVTEDEVLLANADTYVHIAEEWPTGRTVTESFTRTSGHTETREIDPGLAPQVLRDWLGSL